MRRWGLAFLICVCALQPAGAEDAGLKPLSAKLVAIRATHGANTMRDAGPELTPIKHDLREWVEGQLPALGQHGDLAKFAKQMNHTLHALACDAGCSRQIAKDLAEENDRGYLGDVTLSYVDYDRYLAVQTNVGVRCGFDTSAYIYEWRNGSWHLILQSEQDRYGENDYAPQNFLYVLVSSESSSGKERPALPVVLTVGYSPWCASNWQMVYTRVWRVSATKSDPPPMVDEANELFLDDNMADARVTPDEAIVEFKGRSIDSGILVRAHMLHYLVHGNKAERIQPVALNPNDFVDEWLTQPWSESRRWVTADNEAALKKSYASLHEDGRPVLGEFNGAPLRCRADPTLWQVGFGDDAPDSGPYFLVRWMAPYRFTLMDIRKEKSRNCDIADPMRDNVGTLFPFH